MRTIVVGCGRVGAELAYRLYKNGDEVTVVDQAEAAFQKLPTDFRGRTLEGDVLSEEMHHRCGIAKAQGLAAVTNSDSLNAVVAHIAHTVYRVPHVVIRNYDPQRRSLCEAFGLPVISSSSWGAQRMQELLAPDPLRVVFSAGNGEVEIYEIVMDDKLAGRSVEAFLANSGCIAVALTRAGYAMLPLRDMQLQAGDQLHVSATQEGIEALRGRL